jgi:OOP family OmpA-OmpF porin
MKRKLIEDGPFGPVPFQAVRKTTKKEKGFSMKKLLSKVLAAKTTKGVLTALVLFFPLAVRSETRGGSVEINPFLGVNFFDRPQNLNDNLLYGGRISYNLTSRFALEGTLEFVNTNVTDPTITGAVKGQYRSPADKVDLFFYNLDAVFNFLQDDNITVFALAGLGRVYYNPSIATGDMSTFGLGAGAKFWASKNIAIRADIKDNMVTEVFEENEIFKHSYQNLTLTLGLVLAIGGEPEKPTAKTPPEVVYVAEAPAPKVVEQIKVIAADPPVEEKIVVLAFEDVHFNYGKSDLTESAKTIINKSVRILKDNPKTSIRIAGYTSASGTEEFNQGLSERRAKAVENYLIEEGIVSEDRLSTIGYGETRPGSYESAPTQHYSTAAKANMRVLFEVIVK